MTTMRCQAISPDRTAQCWHADDNEHSPHEARGVSCWTSGDKPRLFVPKKQLPWPRFAFSGARKMQYGHNLIVITMLDEIINTRRPIVAVTGAAVGFDAFVAKHLYNEYPESDVHVHTVVPADRAQVDPKWKNHCHSHELMPEGTKFQQRNERMVDLSDHAYACPLKVRQQMGVYIGGTWRFVEYARRWNKISNGDIFVLAPESALRDG